MDGAMIDSARAAQACQRRLEVVAHNIANASTPGFRRILAGFEAGPRLVEAEAAPAAPLGTPIDDVADLIRTLRLLETNLQMIQFRDQALSRAVNDFGRVRA